MSAGNGTAIRFENVDIVFGTRPDAALPLIDSGRSREEILSETGQVLGCCGASLAVEKGEICVLMGLSGSGKSTLLRAVNGLNKVARGKVEVTTASGVVDAAFCSEDELRELRRNGCAFVFQQFALLPWRTVAENVGFGLEVRGAGKEEIDAKVKEKLALVGAQVERVGDE